MDGLNKKKLGDLLVESGKISNEQLKVALKMQKVKGKRLGELLVDENILTEEDILDVLEIQLGIPRVYIDLIEISKEAVLLIPQSLAQKYTLLPIRVKNNKIRVAMSDPLNIFAVDDVKIASGYDVDIVISTKKEIQRGIDRYYSTQFAKKAAEDLSKEQSIINNHISNSEEDDDIKNAPAVRLVDSIITNAVKAKASDIHIEPFEKYVRIRYRVDGELQEMLKSPKDTMTALTTRVKILAGMNIAEKRLPQDGRIITKVDGNKVDLRVSVLPTVYGEKIVIRIMNREGSIIGKDKLGLDDDDIEKLERIIKNPYGIILVTGPTGSGKSTTLYTILNDMNKKNVNIVTVEDPVEYTIEGINQVNVNVKAGLTFAAGLRSILRQDPDVIMIGEIRDSETAEIAIRAAITGHVVLSTIHTNDAPSAVMRLRDMGIEPYLVATSVVGIVAQRLVKKTCPYCKEEYEASDYEKKVLGISINQSLKLSKGKGCAACRNTGYLGRTGIYEIMEVSREHRDAVINGSSIDDLRDISSKKGMKTIRKSCENLVLKGVTTFDELVKVAYLKE